MLSSNSFQALDKRVPVYVLTISKCFHCQPIGAVGAVGARLETKGHPGGVLQHAAFCTAPIIDAVVPCVHLHGEPRPKIVIITQSQTRYQRHKVIDHNQRLGRCWCSQPLQRTGLTWTTALVALRITLE